MSVKLICVFILLFVTAIFSATFNGFYYGERVFTDAGLSIFGIDQPLPNLVANKRVKLNIGYEINYENRKRDIYDNYNNYIGKNKYASYKNDNLGIYSFFINYNNFSFLINRDRDCNYRFVENIFDITNSKIKENERKSEGFIYSYNIFYKIKLLQNLTIYPEISYSKFENEIKVREDFVSQSFSDYNLYGKYNGDGFGFNLLIEYETIRFHKFMLQYKSGIKYKGDYFINDSNGLVEDIKDKEIKYPYEIKFITVLTLPSEHFTKLFVNISYIDWEELKDNNGFSLPAVKPSLKETIIYSLGIKYKVIKKMEGGFAIYYEPTNINNDNKKLGLNLGANYNLNERFNFNIGLNYYTYLYKENYPFTLKATGNRVNRIDIDYSENHNIKINFGIECKL